MTIDTLDYVKKLEAAGVDSNAAEPHAEALRAAIADELATKADIQRLEASTKADIQRLEASISRLEANTKTDISRLEAKIDTKSSELRAEIMKCMIAQTFVMIGVFFTLLRFVR
jgi:chromosome segregation ATPase